MPKGTQVFERLERWAAQAGLHRTWTWLGFGIAVLAIRAALIPLWPIPTPTIYDEFSYILGADTFAHGRLTNPTHPLWEFFEAPYVLQHPTYAAKYPPGASLLMAVGQVLFRNPWFGVWLSCGAMMCALVWAMQGWFPPRWAFVGGLLALPVSLVSYWMNSYWGGSAAAIGGALLLGGYARVRRGQSGYAFAMGIGLGLLANTRPYEGLVFAIPVAIAFLWGRPRLSAIGWLAAALIPAMAATGYYNRAVTGSALNMPFTEYAKQYVYIPLFTFQSLDDAKIGPTAVMKDLHQNWEVREWEKARSWRLIPTRVREWKEAATNITGSILAILAILACALQLWRDRRMRVPLGCVAAVLAGSLIEVRYYPHYAAPATAAVLILAVEAMRFLRIWKVPVARPVLRVLPLIVVAVALAPQTWKIIRQPPPSGPRNGLRPTVIQWLHEQGGRHVVLVHYTGEQSPHEEWVYNGADIDSQEVIWANDLAPAEDAALVEYYKGRKIWKFEPDVGIEALTPYE